MFAVIKEMGRKYSFRKEPPHEMMMKAGLCVRSVIVSSARNQRHVCSKSKVAYNISSPHISHDET